MTGLYLGQIGCRNLVASLYIDIENKPGYLHIFINLPINLQKGLGLYRKPYDIVLLFYLWWTKKNNCSWLCQPLII